MTQLQNSVTIQASTATILAILTDPTTVHALNSNMTILTSTPSPLGGFNATWEYTMAGMTFSGESSTTEFVAGERYTYASKGGIDSRWDWTFAQHDSETLVTLTLTYTMPGSLLGAALNKLVIESQNEKSIKEQLTNLKRMAERR